MRRILVFTTVLASMLFLLVGNAYAAIPAAVAPNNPDVCQNPASGATADFRNTSVYCTEVSDGTNPIFGNGTILYKITQAVVWFGGVVSVIMIIIGGFRYVTSGGDSNATKGAKDTILYAVIGLVVAIFGQLLVTFVISRL